MTVAFASLKKLNPKSLFFLFGTSAIKITIMVLFSFLFKRRIALLSTMAFLIVR